MNIEKLKKQYEGCCNQYAKAFCKKQGFEFDGFVGDDIGGIVMCNDMFLNLHDVVWDVNSNQPKGLISEWYYSCFEDPQNSINYFAYTKGVRI